MEREVRSGTENEAEMSFQARRIASENEISGQFEHLMWAFVWVFKFHTLHIFIKQRNLNLM